MTIIKTKNDLHHNPGQKATDVAIENASKKETIWIALESIVACCNYFQHTF
jgi:hypothetical protein